MQPICKRPRIKEENMAVIQLTQENFAEKTSQGLMLLDFWATWCGPCQMIGPMLDQVAAEENIQIGKINVDEQRELAMQYEIEAIPTLVVMKDGREVDRSVGMLDKTEIKTFYAKYA